MNDIDYLSDLKKWLAKQFQNLEMRNVFLKFKLFGSTRTEH